MTMANLNVVVVGPVEYASGLGKKSTATDITFYDVKQGETTLTIVEATKYPEKLAPLFYATSMADLAVLVVESIDYILGESILMLDAVGLRKGFVVLRNYLQEAQVLPLTKGTVVEGYEFFKDDPVALKMRLLEIAESRAEEIEKAKASASGTVPIDHHFDVKGVGTVVLASVAEGMVRKHDKMRVMPGGKTAEVRSVQKHDDDFDWAVKGDRVGLALRGVSNTELDRGMVLTTDTTVMESASVTGDTQLVKYWPSPLKEGMVLHIGHWMQLSPARVEGAEPQTDWKKVKLRLSFEKPFVHAPGARVVVTYLEGGKLRVAGTMRLE